MASHREGVLRGTPGIVRPPLAGSRMQKLQVGSLMFGTGDYLLGLTVVIRMKSSKTSAENIYAMILLASSRQHFNSQCGLLNQFAHVKELGFIKYIVLSVIRR